VVSLKRVSLPGGCWIEPTVGRGDLVHANAELLEITRCRVPEQLALGWLG